MTHVVEYLPSKAQCEALSSNPSTTEETTTTKQYLKQTKNIPWHHSMAVLSSPVAQYTSIQGLYIYLLNRYHMCVLKSYEKRRSVSQTSKKKA
jgi:hypothetical protein